VGGFFLHAYSSSFNGELIERSLMSVSAANGWLASHSALRTASSSRRRVEQQRQDVCDGLAPVAHLDEHVHRRAQLRRPSERECGICCKPELGTLSCARGRPLESKSSP
jgi:hypothetical protein